MNASLPKRHVAAAVLTVVGGLALIVAGWWIVGFEYRGDWDRFVDSAWWVSQVVRVIGFLAFGKVGFKIALICVAVVVAISGKVVSRRRAAAQRSPAE